MEPKPNMWKKECWNGSCSTGNRHYHNDSTMSSKYWAPKVRKWLTRLVILLPSRMMIDLKFQIFWVFRSRSFGVLEKVLRDSCKSFPRMTRGRILQILELLLRVWDCMGIPSPRFWWNDSDGGTTKKTAQQFLLAHFTGSDSISSHHSSLLETGCLCLRLMLPPFIWMNSFAKSLCFSLQRQAPVVSSRRHFSIFREQEGTDPQEVPSFLYPVSMRRRAKSLLGPRVPPQNGRHTDWLVLVGWSYSCFQLGICKTWEAAGRFDGSSIEHGDMPNALIN